MISRKFRIRSATYERAIFFSFQFFFFLLFIFSNIIYLYTNFFNQRIIEGEEENINTYMTNVKKEQILDVRVTKRSGVTRTGRILSESHLDEEHKWGM